MVREGTAEQVAWWIHQSQRVLFFTGAGISTESGIPDFRTPGGLWEKYPSKELTFEKFMESAKYRALHWQFFWEMKKTISSSVPNPAHWAIAELEKRGKLHGVITQNIDDLHQKTGISLENLVQLHGDIRRIHCLSCGREFNIEELSFGIEEFIPPNCQQCNGLLRPGVVFFGETMPPKEIDRAKHRAFTCDLCFSVGSSLIVYPAAHLPFLARQQGAKLIIVNQQPTHGDEMADAVFHGKAGEIINTIWHKYKAVTNTA